MAKSGGIKNFLLRQLMVMGGLMGSPTLSQACGFLPPDPPTELSTRATKVHQSHRELSTREVGRRPAAVIYFLHICQFFRQVSAASLQPITLKFDLCQKIMTRISSVTKYNSTSPQVHIMLKAEVENNSVTILNFTRSYRETCRQCKSASLLCLAAQSRQAPSCDDVVEEQPCAEGSCFLTFRSKHRKGPVSCEVVKWGPAQPNCGQVKGSASSDRPSPAAAAIIPTHPPPHLPDLRVDHSGQT